MVLRDSGSCVLSEAGTAPSSEKLHLVKKLFRQSPQRIFPNGSDVLVLPDLEERRT